MYSLIITYFERSTLYRADTYKKNITNSANREEILRVIEANIDYANGEVLEAFYLTKNMKYYTDIGGSQERDFEHQLFYKILKSYYIMEKKNRYDIKINILFFQIYILTLDMKLPNPQEALTYKSLMDKEKLCKYYSLFDFEKIMISTPEKKELFLKKLLKRVSIDNENILIDYFFVHSLNLLDPKEFQNKNSMLKVLNDKEDVALSVFNRQYLRSQILFSICHSYFYERGEKFQYYKKEFDSLPRVKKN